MDAPLFIFFGVQILAVLFFALILLRAIVQLVSDQYDVPLVRMSPRAFPLIEKALDMQSAETLYDLGSGDGGFALYLASRRPDVRIVGFELNPLLVWFAQWRARRRRLTNIEFIRGNLFDCHFSDVQKIYIYLRADVLEKLLPRLSLEFRGRLASGAFEFKGKAWSERIEISKKKGSFGQHLLYVYDF